MHFKGHLPTFTHYVIITRMLKKTRMIILRIVRYADSKVIVDAYTETDGRVSFAVVLSSKGKMKRQLFQPLMLLEADCDIKANAQLHRLREVRMLSPMVSLYSDMSKMGIVMFLSSHLQVYHITRNYVRYEYHQVIHSRNGFSFSSHVCYFNLLQQGKLFSFSCHFYSSLFNSVQKYDYFSVFALPMENIPDCNLYFAFLWKKYMVKVL